MAPIAKKLSGLGLQVEEIDGHSARALQGALARRSQDGALVIVLNTVKGHGVSFMEDRLEWHYLPMKEAQYHQALSELRAG